MQPKFTLRKLGFHSLKVSILFLALTVISQVSFSQQKSEEAEQRAALLLKSNNDAGLPSPAIANQANSPYMSKPSSAQRIEAVCATFTGSLMAGDNTMPQRLNRPGGPNSGNCAGGWVFPGTFGTGPYFYDTYTYTNNSGSTQCGTFTLNTTDVTNANIAFGIWNTSFDANNLATGSIAAPNTSTGTPIAAPMVLNVTINAGQTIVIAVWSANVNTAPSGTASNYTVTVEFPLCAPCVPTNASAPVISSVPSTTCVGSPVTLSIISGQLNGASEWRWYTGSCGGTLVGTGTSITVSPAVTTTYYARGEGGCAPAPGPCSQQTITVTPCTCLNPDATTICAGTIQRIAVQPTGATSTTFSSAVPISIPGTGTSGIASPYPAVVAASGLPATGAGVYVESVQINGLSHTWPSDIDMVLVSPSGQRVILMSDVGGSVDAVNANLVFRDNATSLLGTPIVSGTYRPTNTAGPDNFPAPGPGSITNINPTLASFTPTGDPNGNWNLFVVDQAGGDVGSITSWSITFRVVPSATWTASPAAPNTMFTNPAATVAYVPGTLTDVIWVNPTTTTTYTANVNTGPCAGNNSVTVTVLPRPTITVSPNPGGCAPVNLTASGGSVYNWSPGTGLNTTTGPTVTATPPANTVYTVTGFAANGCSNTATVPVNGTSISAVISAPPAFTNLLSQDFATVVPLPAGWASQNLSAPVGTTGWFQGNTAVFPAQSGAPTSYIGANFNNTAGTGTISNWLFTPNLTFQNGDEISFWTRTVGAPAFPDRLELRMSTNGASVDAGASSTSVGDFTNLLLTVNSGLTTAGYPNAWTRFTATVSGLAGPTSGRFAFRYFVTNGGPSGANSDYIGIDNVQVNRPLAGVCPNTVSTISVAITGGVSPYTLVYSNGSTNTSFPGYTSGTPIQVSPSVTTSYTIVSVTGANGCAGVGNSGVATINVIQPPAITSQPANATTCAGSNATFSVSATPAVASTTFQWQESTNGGVTWTNLANGGVYSGVTLPTLTITGATAGMNGYRYRVVVSGQCPPQPVTSASALLTVNVPPAISTNPVSISRCLGTTATFSVAATVASGNSALTYQWQVSVDGGVTYSNVSSGGTSATLTLTNITQSMSGNRYRCVVTNVPCATTATSTAATLTVIPLPVVSISSPVLQLVPGRTTTITGTSNPAAAAGGWAWTLNGSAIAGTTNTQTVNIDGVGTYQATVTDVNGCVAKSNLLVIGSEASDRLWIYPNPTDGAFQVRLYYDSDVAERRTVTIYNMLGQVITSKQFSLVDNTAPYLRMDFDLTNMMAGTYVVRVVHEYTQKVVSGLVVVQ